jgi:hypothetical protein
MTVSKKWGVLLSLTALLMMPLAPAKAGMVSTESILHQQDRTRLAEMLDRSDVKQQLIGMGVDPAFAKARIEQMTDAEIAQLNGRISELPAGAGVGTVELLLIIIILILVL